VFGFNLGLARIMSPRTVSVGWSIGTTSGVIEASLPYSMFRVLCCLCVRLYIVFNFFVIVYCICLYFVSSQFSEMSDAVYQPVQLIF
jgi:hypothetical protein